MTRTLCFLLCIAATFLLIVGCVATNVPVTNSAAEPPSKHIIVVEFSDKSNYTYGRLRYDASKFMEHALAQTGKVLVTTREQWEPKLQGTNIAERTFTDDIEKAVAIGKLAGADIVIIGTIYRFVVDVDDTESPMLSRRYEYSATAKVRAQVIDVASSQIIVSTNAIGSADKFTTRFFRAGSSVAVDAVNERTLLKQSLKDATRNLSYNIVKKL